MKPNDPFGTGASSSDWVGAGAVDDTQLPEVRLNRVVLRSRFQKIPTSGLKATKSLSLSAALVDDIDDCASKCACGQTLLLALGRT